jgi:hypothetical protein
VLLSYSLSLTHSIYTNLRNCQNPFLIRIHTYTYTQATGLAPDSFASYLLAHQEEYSLSDDEAAYLAGSMFGAGADTVRPPFPL